MKNLKPIAFIIVVLVLTAVTSYPQSKFQGFVTKVLDGKTCVIAVPGGEITAVLQYVEIPEPEQKLRDTVKDHLTRLVLDKPVEFLPRTVMRDRTVGQIIVNGVDVSQQMLRDGAVWLMPIDSSGQDALQNAEYKDNETQARSEKRGVWGVENLLAPWEFRAEQRRLAEQRQRDEIERVRREAAAVRPGARNVPRSIVSSSSYLSEGTDLFVDPFEANRYDTATGYGGLRTNYDPLRNITRVNTPTMVLEMPSKGWVTKLNARFYFFHRGQVADTPEKIYAIGVAGVSYSKKFSQATKLIVYADGRAYDLGKAFYFNGKNTEPDSKGELAEVVFYRISQAQLAKFASARSITLQVGSYRGAIPSQSGEYIRNLYNSTAN